MTTLEDVIRIAVNAHDGQKDMIGNPAIQHVLAVGLMGSNELEQKAGYLHDVVEDTDLTIAIHVKLNDLRHNLLRAEHSLGILAPTGSTQALYEEILQIAIKHDWAERFIRERS